VLTFKVCIISYFTKNPNIPITRADHIKKYRKKNAGIRHEYFTLATKHRSLSKRMFTFTVGGRGRGVYTKLRIANDIKSYITYLISNCTSDIYFFTNIEIGSELSNPHVHSQVWSDDISAVEKIYDMVIDKFGLVKKRCSLSEPQQNLNFYTYAIKDYSNDLSDNDVWNIEKTKYRMRKTLGLRLRFYSRSKSKYQSKLYKIMYRYYGVLREFADKFLDNFFSLFFKKERIFKASISSFITIKNKASKCLKLFLFRRLFRHWLDILFYSPSRDPPILLFCELLVRGFT